MCVCVCVCVCVSADIYRAVTTADMTERPLGEEGCLRVGVKKSKGKELDASEIYGRLEGSK